MQTKILIIKLGYSETLDPEIGIIVSLGDVLRATVILWALKEKYPDSHISWVVSSDAHPLLSGNRFIDRILIWDQFLPFQLMKEKFDILINLEKIPGLCAIADSIDAWTKYGFRFDSLKGSYDAYEKGLRFIDYIESKKANPSRARGAWQQVLIEMLGGVEWKGQKYIIGYQPKSAVSYDVGLNYLVGSKWPSKGMPLEKWQSLEKILIAAGHSVSWQRGLENLYDYMDWIHSCRLIISNDSLGLHIAFSYGKQVIGLFGPTDPSEIYLYDESAVLRSNDSCPDMPCWSAHCTTGLNCMSNFDLHKISGEVDRILNPSQIQDDRKNNG